MNDERAVIAKELDFTGWKCYQINLTLKVELEEIPIGAILKFITDTPNVDEKLYKWCRDNNQELFLSDFKNGKYHYYIKRLH